MDSTDYNSIIRLNKIKKLMLLSLKDFIDDTNIWELSSVDFTTKTGYPLNSLKLKELFFKDILPDLSYNNFGLEENVVVRLKNLKQFDSQSSEENFDEDNTRNVAEEQSNTQEMTSDPLHEQIVESMEQIFANSEEVITDFDDVQSIIEKYQITQPTVESHSPNSQDVQISENLHTFTTSQLMEQFEIVEHDPLGTNDNAKNYDAFDFLCDGGRLSDVPRRFSKIPEVLAKKSRNLNYLSQDSQPLESSSKRKSIESSSNDVNNSADHFSVSAASNKSIVELDSIIDMLDNDVDNHFESSSNELEKLLEPKQTENLQAESNKDNSNVNLTEEYEILDENAFNDHITILQNHLNATNFDGIDELNRFLDDNDEFRFFLKIPTGDECDKNFQARKELRQLFYTNYLRNKSKYEAEKKADPERCRHRSRYIQREREMEIAKLEKAIELKTHQKVATQSTIKSISVRDVGTDPITGKEHCASKNILNESNVGNGLNYFKYNENQEFLGIGTLKDNCGIFLSASTHSKPYTKKLDLSFTERKSMVDIGTDAITHEEFRLANIEKIEQIKQQLNAATTHEEINQIIKGNEKLFIYIKIPTLNC